MRHAQRYGVPREALGGWGVTALAPARLPVQRPHDARVLIVHRDGTLERRERARWIASLRAGDVVVANDAATLPASLASRHAPTGAPVELRLAGHAPRDAHGRLRFIAVAFGAGDWRTRTEERAAPPAFVRGDVLHCREASLVVDAVLGHPRLLRVHFDGDDAAFWSLLARAGRPVQYAHLAVDLAPWDVATPIAGRPVAFEAPSAGYALDWRTIAAMRERGIALATLTHAAGLSSTGDAALDARLPLPEPYDIPAATVEAIARARVTGGRVVAVGTTVVRALEHAAHEGRVRAGPGVADQRVGPATRRHVVDALLTGVHEAGSSHYELLRAFASDATLARASRVLAAEGYRSHEFGDSMLVFAARNFSPAAPNW